jgi:hypothetical protein
MSKGIIVLAQNNSVDNYVDQACLLAMSLKIHNTVPISLVTDDNVPEEYVDLFDQIIPIPFGDKAKNSDWKIENRWKLYYCSPYKETIVMDTDMLVLQNIDSWFDFLSKYKMFFTSKVLNYRGTESNTFYYRKTFVHNNLPNLFSGLHYFKKCEFAQDFYHWMEMVLNNWEAFYEQHLTAISRPAHPSIDVCAAITARIMGCENDITNNNIDFFTFTHMKAHCQGWNETHTSSSWQDQVNTYISKDGTLKIGNYLQTGILHYTEKDFLKKIPVLECYRNLINV